ncbi:MAG: hypothetical protein RIG61_06250 [Deltaproteobacteria bacterium]
MAIKFNPGLIIIVALLISFHSAESFSESVKHQAAGEAAGLDEAWEVLSGYHKDPHKIKKSIDMTEGILRKDPRNVEALLFLSRLWLTQGYVMTQSREELIRAFEEGKNTAEKALEIEPENADAHFFYVANLASLGDAKGLFNSLFMLPEVRRELDMILELDPGHPEGLAMNGALYYYLPGILGGDLYISEVYLRRALSVNPHLSSARIYLAMNLYKQKKYDETKKVLLELINDKEPSFYPDWYLNRRYALKILRQINKEMRKQTAKGSGNEILN